MTKIPKESCFLKTLSRISGESNKDGSIKRIAVELHTCVATVNNKN